MVIFRHWFKQFKEAVSTEKFKSSWALTTTPRYFKDFGFQRGLMDYTFVWMANETKWEADKESMEKQTKEPCEE